MHAMNRARSKPIHSREDEGLSDSDLEKITIAEYFLESAVCILWGGGVDMYRPR